MTLWKKVKNEQEPYEKDSEYKNRIKKEGKFLFVADDGSGLMTEKDFKKYKSKKMRRL